MMNSGATLTCAVKKLLCGMDNVVDYMDNLLVHTETWEANVETWLNFLGAFERPTSLSGQLMRKGQPNTVNWGDSQEKAYNSLKFAVTSKTVLQLPDFDKRFILRTYASSRGLGAALMQESDGILFPVAYASKKSTDRERKFSVIEREALVSGGE
ncbi:retrovirus-related Pol polyprotein from transposon 412 [Elysia marginata]|uniref:Retrovirus-related Pol polyprotein from transposon 412 n=1 Tax=Elysia marginata TaxID=1093978 RepID=A0AAV4EE82_9GAST|nr:retrovirus-related Pol polyprotein from transposon 412 [Elysia marginata]